MFQDYKISITEVDMSGNVVHYVIKDLQSSLALNYQVKNKLFVYYTIPGSGQPWEDVTPERLERLHRLITLLIKYNLLPYVCS